MAECKYEYFGPRSSLSFEFWVWVSVAWPLALIDMCLCVYGQQGVLNLQPHIKKLQAKMAALVQLRPQHNHNNNNNMATKRPKIKRLRNANYNKRRRFNGNK